MTYKEFIQNILDTRGHFGVPEGVYKEKQHIIPKCLGGTNSKDNLVDLYAKEHYIAHKLLALENPDNYKLQYAWLSMGFLKSKYIKDRYEISAEEYERLKELDSHLASKKMSGSGNPMYGKVHSEETRRKIGEKSKGRYFSEESRKKISAHLKGKPRSEEVRKKISEGHEGKIFTEEHRKNLSKSRIVNKIGCIPVNQYDKNGNLLKTWDSASQAGKELNIPNTNITRCCRKRELKTAGGFIWRYSEEGE